MAREGGGFVDAVVALRQVSGSSSYAALNSRCVSSLSSLVETNVTSALGRFRS